MDIIDLRHLSTTIRAGNFSRAARQLGLNPATVSRRIARLEDEIGVTLFERGPSGIRMTTAGDAIMIHVHRALENLEAIVGLGRNGGVGRIRTVRLGVRMPPVGEPLRGLLSAWRDQHRAVSLSVHEMNDHEINAALAERRLDVAIVTRHSTHPDSITVPLYRERLFVALPEGHRLVTHGTLTLGMLRSETVLTQGWGDSHVAREFFASLLGSGVTFSSHAASKQTIRALVASGFGLTLTTASQAQVRFPGVVYCPICEDDAWVDVDLAWMSENKDPAVGGFVAFMRDESRVWS